MKNILKALWKVKTSQIRIIKDEQLKKEYIKEYKKVRNNYIKTIDK